MRNKAKKNIVVRDNRSRRGFGSGGEGGSTVEPISAAQTPATNGNGGKSVTVPGYVYEGGRAIVDVAKATAGNFLGDLATDWRRNRS